MSTEHSMIILLSEIVFRSYNSSLLRQHTVNRSFFWIHLYTSATLGRVLTYYVAVLCVDDGQMKLLKMSED